MKAFLLPIFSAVIVLAAGCGSSSNVSSDDSGNRNYYDGYSTSETHSAQHVEMKDADAMTYLTFEDYVQSHASGVDIDSNGDLVIRGMGTFNGSSKPLIIMDGTEVQNTRDINPMEISSIDVLKDASSTAIYGIRGANGVIIVTSKARKQEKEAAKAARKAKKD